MSAPAYVARSTKTVLNGTGGASNTVALPYMAGIQPGDYLLICAVNQFPGALTGSVTIPAGFTSLGVNASFSDSSAAFSGTMAIWERIADGSEIGSVDVGGFSDVNWTLTCQMYQFRMTPSGRRILLGSSATKGDQDGAATIIWPAITIPGAGRTLLAFHAGTHNSSPAISGYTLQADDDVLMLFTKEDVSSDGSVTSIGGGSAGYATAHMSIFSPAGRNQILNN